MHILLRLTKRKKQKQLGIYYSSEYGDFDDLQARLRKIVTVLSPEQGASSWVLSHLTPPSAVSMRKKYLCMYAYMLYMCMLVNMFVCMHVGITAEQNRRVPV